MDYLLYKVIHIVGIVLAFVALGGLTLVTLAGGESPRARKLVGITHGLALVIILISGFGLIAKLGLGFPLWVWVKVAIWILMGALLALIRRMPQHAVFFWVLLPVLGAVAAWLALYKPF